MRSSPPGLYDEKYDSAESVNVATKPENKDLIATLSTTSARAKRALR